MVRKLIEWALDNPLVVVLISLSMAIIGIYSFLNVNVEAYPDPAPAIVEVFAQFPGASAEEVERQVTIPLEVTFAGMPGLKSIHSKSLYGLSDLKMNWNYGSRWTYEAGAAGSHQSPGDDLAAAAYGRDAANLARISDGRNLPLRASHAEGLERPRGLHAQRSESAPGLGDGAGVPRGAANCRRLQLGRHRPTLRNPTRSRPSAPLRHHAGAAAGGDLQQQRHGRRRLRQPGPGRHDGPQRRTLRRRRRPRDESAGD